MKNTEKINIIPCVIEKNEWKTVIEVVVVVQYLKNPVLSINNGGGRIYLIILEIV